MNINEKIQNCAKNTARISEGKNTGGFNIFMLLSR